MTYEKTVKIIIIKKVNILPTYMAKENNSNLLFLVFTFGIRRTKPFFPVTSCVCKFKFTKSVDGIKTIEVKMHF